MRDDVMQGTLELDLHGKNKFQAQVALDSALRRAPKHVYRILVIHGHTRGTELRDFVRKTYRGHPRVAQVDPSGDGRTVLVLRR